MHFATWLYTKIFGNFVGEDQFGNHYYENKKWLREMGRNRRWIYYALSNDPSIVPNLWFAWLHYQTSEVPHTNSGQHKDHKPSLTGEIGAYFPPGHPIAKGQREQAIGDYHPWDQINLKK